MKPKVMEPNRILCSQCGITLRPFMRLCPKCGVAREGATELVLPSEPVSRPAAMAQTPAAVPGIETDQTPAADPATDLAAQKIYLSPPDTERRFPVFTSAQLTLIVIGLLLLVTGMVIAWLLWRQQVRDQQLFEPPPASSGQARPAIPASVPGVMSESAPGASEDQLLEEAVRATLTAYNPFGMTRYRYRVEAGVVTIDGEAEHQPEKEGAGNVLRLVSGVKRVVNRLAVKAEPGSTPLRVDDVRARALELALRRHLETQGQSQSASLDPVAISADTPVVSSEAEREAERLRRELALLRQRADELARRQAAEERLRREAEEGARREAEQRRQIEAERQRLANTVRREPPSLRAGTVAWSGVVDGADDILLAGDEATIRHLSGNYPAEVRASFSAPLPRAAARVSLVATRSRGEIRIVQSPSAENGYTAIVRVDDTRKGGERRFEFTLRWELEEGK